MAIKLPWQSPPALLPVDAEFKIQLDAYMLGEFCWKGPQIL